MLSIWSKTIHSVRIARFRTEVNAKSNWKPSCLRSRPASFASASPFSDKSTSVHPVNLFSLFHVLSPWRKSTNFIFVIDLQPPLFNKNFFGYCMFLPLPCQCLYSPNYQIFLLHAGRWLHYTCIMKASNALLIGLVIIVWGCVLMFGFIAGLKKVIKPAPKSHAISGADLLDQQKRMAEDIKRQQDQAMEYQKRRMRDMQSSAQSNTRRPVPTAPPSVFRK